MNWKKYENEIFETFKKVYPTFKKVYPNAKIKYNQKIVGRYSKTERQIDILIEGSIAGKKLCLVIDGKYYSKNIDVKDVDSFISMVEDIDAAQGIMITSKGYSKAAINRAYYGPTDIELDILNFDDLKQFQGFEGITYSGWHGAIIPAPFGWVVDGTKQAGSIATLYQRGKTYEEAIKKGEFIYVNILSFNEKIKNLDDVIKLHKEATLFNNPKATFEYTDSIERTDKKKTLLRRILREETHLEEYTGFVEFDEFCIFCVLFTPVQLKTKNIRKLEYVIERLIPMNIDLNSIATAKISNYENLIKKSKSNQEKSSLLVHIAEVHTDMKDYENSKKKYLESIEIYPKNYGARLGLLELDFDSKNREKLTDELFELAPGNPSICDDLGRLYFQKNNADLLINYFIKKIDKYKADSNILGNTYYALGYLYYNMGKDKNAVDNFNLAEKYLSKSLEKEHYVFKIISKIKTELKN